LPFMAIILFLSEYAEGAKLFGSIRSAVKHAAPIEH
jgi:hypothetical protein